MKLTTFFSTLFLVFLFIGCGKSPPPGLPPLAPCKIKVHNNGSPVENIGVTFQRTEGQSGWSLNCQTGPDGVGVVQTIAGSYEAKGIPIGKYRITLRERIELPAELMGDDYDQAVIAKQQQYLAEHRTLPAILYNASQTPLELTVTESGAELDVDVAKYK